MNRSTTEITRHFCAFLAAGVIGTLAGCGSSKTQAADADAIESTDGAEVAEAGMQEDAAMMAEAADATEQMGAAPDGEMMPVIQSFASPEGLVIEDLRIGDGAEATANSTVVIHFHETLTDGTVVDSTRGKEPFKRSIKQFIQGCQQGVTGMRVGGIRRLTVPPELGYGAMGVARAGIPGNATLTLSVELIDVKPTAKADADKN